jgi:hypothetical protein
MYNIYRENTQKKKKSRVSIYPQSLLFFFLFLLSVYLHLPYSKGMPSYSSYPSAKFMFCRH